MLRKIHLLPLEKANYRVSPYSKYHRSPSQAEPAHGKVKRGEEAFLNVYRQVRHEYVKGKTDKRPMLSHLNITHGSKCEALASSDDNGCAVIEDGSICGKKSRAAGGEASQGGRAPIAILRSNFVVLRPAK